MSRKITRRNFTKLAGAAAVATPILARASAMAQQPQQSTPAPAEELKPKYGMTKEQEDRVKQSVERGERGRGPLRTFPLAYSAEPSFVFKARIKSK